MDALLTMSEAAAARLLNQLQGVVAQNEDHCLEGWKEAAPRMDGTLHDLERDKALLTFAETFKIQLCFQAGEWLAYKNEIHATGPTPSAAVAALKDILQPA